MASLLLLLWNFLRIVVTQKKKKKTFLDLAQAIPLLMEVDLFNF